MFKRSVQNYAGSAARNMWSKCRYDCRKKFSSRRGVRVSMLYSRCGKYSKKCEKCSTEEKRDKREKYIESSGELFEIKEEDIYVRAEKVADAVLADLYLPEFEEMKLIRKMAYAPRYEKWKQLGILPGGAKSEVCHGVVKCSTNLNSDPADMLKDCLKLGISTGIYGLTLTNLLNDIVLGEPKLRMAPVGLRVIDPDYINIMITGHQHSMFTYLQERLTDADITKKAKEAGAKGFKLVGCTCVGQDLQLRGAHYEEVFDGHAGNNYTSEGHSCYRSDRRCNLRI